MALLLASLTAIAAACCLLCQQWMARVQASRYLHAYISAKAGGFILLWLLVHPDTPFKALWLAGYLSLSFLLAPLLWRINPIQTDKRDWLITGMVIGSTAPLMLAAHSGSLLVDPARPAIGITASVIHEFMLIGIGLFVLQVSWYFWRWRKSAQAAGANDFFHLSNPDHLQVHTFRLLAQLLACQWIIMIGQTLISLSGGSARAAAILITLDCLATLMAIRTLVSRIAAPASTASPPEPKYARSALNDTVRVRIEMKLHDALSDAALYKQPGLKLADLCRHMHEDAHYVSQVISQHLQTSFYELVNRKRIEEACRLLSDPAEKTILDIAMDSGYNSKSTFNAAFKRQMGMTPSEYRTRQVERLTIAGPDPGIDPAGF